MVLSLQKEENHVDDTDLMELSKAGAPCTLWAAKLLDLFCQLQKRALLSFLCVLGGFGQKSP